MTFSRPSSRAFSFSVFLFLTVIAGLGAIAEEESSANHAPLRAVLVRTAEILASNTHGLFRASKNELKWAPIAIPPSMPPGGMFAKQPDEARPIWYYTPKWTAYKNPRAENKILGLYVSEDGGQQWRLRSNAHDFREVLVHSDGTLYAIIRIVAEIDESTQVRGVWVSEEENERGNRTIHFDRIVMSTDSGKSWRDISSGIGRGVSLTSIFADPDHPNLVCLNGNAIRSYILQATDKDYSWQLTREWEWWKTRQTEDQFFRSTYYTGSILYVHRATLSNYFDHPFSNRIKLPAFSITTDQESYSFDQGSRATVHVEVAFIPREPQVKILDLEGELGFWGIKRILPDGDRESISASIGRSIDESKSRDDLRAELRKSPDMRIHTIGKSLTHKRSLDLSDLCDFSQPGKHRLQLIYDSSWIADRTKDEWPGSFSSPVFSVTIEK